MNNKLQVILDSVLKQVKVLNIKKPFAVFDFDNTCIVNDIGEAVLAYMARHDLFKDKTLLDGIHIAALNYSEAIFKYYYNLLEAGQIEDAYKFGASILSGYTVEEVDELIRKTIKFENEAGPSELFGLKIAHGLNARFQIISLMAILNDNGIEPWVVSASAYVLVERAMKHFSLTYPLIAVKNIITSGIIDKTLEQPLSILEGKVECIKRFIDSKIQPVIGVGDSMNDLSMLEYSQIKVVVDRQNQLAAKAKKYGWLLI